jgi:hypothetical protein
MAAARRWNLADFDVVLDGGASSLDDLAAALPRRRAAEIARLRAMIHASHGPPDHVLALPTDAMARHFGRRRGTLVCAVCGVRF